MSFFKKLTETHLKIIGKTVPKNLQPAATKLFNAANPAASFGQFIGEQSGCKDFACRREALRRHHERTTSPGSQTNRDSYKADQLIYLGKTPEQRAEGERIRREVNASTLKRGMIGIAVGATVVGGAAGAAIGAGGKAAGASGVKSLVDDAQQANQTPGRNYRVPVQTRGAATSQTPIGMLALALAGLFIF